jgi:hypothetical protein
MIFRVFTCFLDFEIDFLVLEGEALGCVFFDDDALVDFEGEAFVLAAFDRGLIGSGCISCSSLTSKSPVLDCVDLKKCVSVYVEMGGGRYASALKILIFLLFGCCGRRYKYDKSLRKHVQYFSEGSLTFTCTVRRMYRIPS